MPLSHRARRAASLLASSLLVVLATGLALAATAPAHDGEPHDEAPAPPQLSPEQLAEQVADERREAAFERRLASAPLERSDETCGATVAFADVGDGCRTRDGLLRVETSTGASILTHGPDYAESPSSASVSDSTQVVAAVQAATKDDVACVPANQTRTRLVYAIPSDGLDRSDDQVPRFRQSVYELSAVLDNESRSVAPTHRKRLRVACNGASEAEVQVLRLATPKASADFSSVIRDLHRANGTAGSTGNAHYLVFYDDHLGSYGGIGQWFGDDVLSPQNQHMFGGHVALQDNSYDAGPSWGTLMHELGHNLGAVSNASPNSTQDAHCTDGRDVMCYDDGGPRGSQYAETACAFQAWDCGHDDYFNPAPVGGTWLAGHWNLASPFNAYLEHDTQEGDVDAPSVPTGLAAAGHGTYARLTWSASSDGGGSGVHSYRVYKQVGATWVAVANVWPGSRTIDVDDLVSSTAYTFAVTSFDRRGNESAKAQVAVNTGAWDYGALPNGPNPPTPTDLRAASRTGTSVQLTWRKGLTGPDHGFWVYSKPASSGGSASYAGYASTGSYEVTGLTANTEYVFEIEAVDYSNGGGNATAPRVSVHAFTAGGAATPPSAPTGVHVEASSGGQVSLAWDAVAGATDYAVFVRNPDTSWPTAPAVATGATTATVRGLAWGANATIGVVARNERGDASSYATVGHVVPAAPDTTPPAKPSLSGWTYSSTSIGVSWGAVAGATEYRIYTARTDEGWTQRVSTTGTTGTATGLLPHTEYQFKVVAYDAAGNSSDDGAYFLPDTDPAADVTAPSQPGTVTASNVSGIAADLSWDPATDAVGVTGYRVYRQNADASWTRIGETAGTTFTARSLGLNAAYTLGVTAVDAGANESARRTVAFTTSSSLSTDVTPPTQPGTASASNVAGTSLDLSWGASTDAVGVTGYRVYRQNPDTSWTQIATSATTSASLTGLTSGVTYTFGVAARDASGNESAKRTVSATTLDVVAPGQPGAIVASNLAHDQVDLDWPAATDNVAVTGYRVYRQNADTTWTLLGTVAGTYAQITSLTQSRAYVFGVAARDAAGNESARRTVALTTPADPTPPSSAGTVVASNVTGTTVDLSWGAATDNVGVTGYRVYRRPAAGGAWTLAGSPAGTSFQVTGLAPGVAYTFGVTARDLAGNESATKSTVDATTPDTLAPSPPGSLRSTSTRDVSVDLTWNASTDNVAVTGYKVYRQDGPSTWTELSAPTATSYEVTSLTASTEYTFGVVALDAAANESPRATFTVTTSAEPDVASPTQPGALTASDVTHESATLTWTAATDDLAVTGYRLYRRTAPSTWAHVADLVGTTRALTGLVAQSDHTYGVTALDAAGNESSRAEVTFHTSEAPDVIPPFPVSGIAATVAADGTVNLTWNFAFDASGVASYRVYRLVGAMPPVLVGTTTALSYSVTGLERGVTHRFSITAIDVPGNESPHSVRDVAVPLPPAPPVDPTPPGDPTPPTDPTPDPRVDDPDDPTPPVVDPPRPPRADTKAPVTKQMTVKARTRTALTLAWLAPVDDTGVTGIEIRITGPGIKGGARTVKLPGKARATVLKGLRARTTYKISIRARDASGNLSPWSKPVVGRTR